MALRIEHSDPVRAARAVLGEHQRYGYAGNIDDSTLRAIADAVLATADTVATVTELCAREMWAFDQRYREYVRSRLRQKLLDAITSEGRVPTALPVEELCHTDMRMFMMSTDSDVPDSAVIPTEMIEQGAEWTHVEVVLSVPVRTPPVDRKAAVKAGLLYG